MADEPKRQATFRRFGDEAQAQRLREEKTPHYVRWTFFAAIAVAIVGLIGVGLTLLLRRQRSPGSLAKLAARRERSPASTPSIIWQLLARTIPVDVYNALSLLAAGRASEYLPLVPQVTEIVIGRASCWGGELAAIRARR